MEEIIMIITVPMLILIILFILTYYWLNDIEKKINEQNSKLERIAKALEEADTEPYYIKKDG